MILMPKKISMMEFNKQLLAQKKINPYEVISPTAWKVAYARTFSNIPYAKKIYNELEKIRLANSEPNLPEELKFVDLAPNFEARHKLINKLLAKEKNSQILDIAAGLSPHGLELSRNEKINYVEVDLPTITKQKRQIVKIILKRDALPNRPNLHLEIGDATKITDLNKAVRYFKKKKSLTVITEGLLYYLDTSEKIQVANNIKKLLKKFGGVWITPDINYRRKMKSNFVANTIRVSAITGINLEKNKFKNIQEAKDLFDKLGFSIKVHNFMEVANKLVSPKKLKMSDAKVKEIIGPRVVFVMKIK